MKELCKNGDTMKPIRRSILSALILLIRHFHISHNAPYLPPTPPQKKFCISIVFNFSWDGCNTRERWKTKVMQEWGGGGKKGALWEMGKGRQNQAENVSE